MLSGCCGLLAGFAGRKALTNFDVGIQLPVRYSFGRTSSTHKRMAKSNCCVGVKFKSSIMFAKRDSLRRFRRGSSEVDIAIGGGWGLSNAASRWCFFSFFLFLFFFASRVPTPTDWTSSSAPSSSFIVLEVPNALNQHTHTQPSFGDHRLFGSLQIQSCNTTSSSAFYTSLPKHLAESDLSSARHKTECQVPGQE